MRQDPIADALSNIRNAERAGQGECEIKPASKLLGNVLDVMQQAGYIGAYEFVDDHRSGSFQVELVGNVNECGVIRPRFSVQTDDIEEWEARYLPGRNFGKLILTTTQGVVDHNEAKDLGVGGKLLAYVY
jgi:small subunit ribosomal protein S8